jgi:hypothetical protein
MKKDIHLHSDEVEENFEIDMMSERIPTMEINSSPLSPKY